MRVLDSDSCKSLREGETLFFVTLEILQGKEIWKKVHGWGRTAGTNTHRQDSTGHVGARGSSARWAVGECRHVRIESWVKAELCRASYTGL